MSNSKKAVQALSEDEITVIDILERADEVASTLTHGRPPSNSQYTPKVETKVRLDADVVDWLKALGPRHYSRINGILKAVMEAEKLSARVPEI